MTARSPAGLAASLVASGLSLSPAEAQTVMEFDGLYTGLNGIVSVGSLVIEDGFRLSADEGADFSAIPSGLVSRQSSNGTTTLYTYVFTGPNVSFTLDSVNGDCFDLTSTDVAESFNAGDPGHDSGLVTVDVIGTSVGGGSVSTSFTVDGISDGIGGADDFQTFALPSAFRSLSTVRFVAYSGARRSSLNFDNITLQAGSNCCDGLPDASWGLCDAYCEAMDCNGVSPKASSRACSRVLENFAAHSNEPIPCAPVECPIDVVGTYCPCNTSFVYCAAVPPDCPTGTVLATQYGCWKCVDPRTCNRI